MKRILSPAIAMIMVMSLAPAMAVTSVEYIPSPYTVAEGAKITNTYCAPKYFENGPTIGVTVLGVLDMVEDLEVRALKRQSQEYSGERIDVCTLEEVEDITELPEEFHARGDVVIGSIKLDQPLDPDQPRALL